MVTDPRLKEGRPTVADNVKAAIVGFIVCSVVAFVSAFLLGVGWFRTAVAVVLGLIAAAVSFGLAQEWCVESRYWRTQEDEAKRVPDGK